MDVILCFLMEWFIERNLKFKSILCCSVVYFLLKKEDLDNISSLDSRSLITAFHYSLQRGASFRSWAIQGARWNDSWTGYSTTLTLFWLVSQRSLLAKDYSFPVWKKDHTGTSRSFVWVSHQAASWISSRLAMGRASREHLGVYLDKLEKVSRV